MEVKSSSLLGHKLRCFDVSISSGRRPGTEYEGEVTRDDFLLSASEDGTAKLWRIKSSEGGSLSGKCEHTFMHSKDDEVLRAAFIDEERVICTAGADGKVIVWSESQAAEEIKSSSGKGTQVVKYKRHYQQACTLSHGEGQLYVCEKLVDKQLAHEVGLSGSIMTAADDVLYIWDLGLNASADPRTWTFDSIVDKSSGAAYGGPRNEENVAYIFDAKPFHRESRMLAVALSDGSVRIVDTSTTKNKPDKAESGSSISNVHVGADGDICVNVASMVARLSSSSQGSAPPHVTGLAVSEDDRFLVVSLGDGKVAVLNFKDGLKAAPCLVDLITAHTASCFGILFLDNGDDEETGASGSSASSTISTKRRRVSRSLRCVTWSSDGSVALWNLGDLVQTGGQTLTSLPAPEAGRVPESRVTMPGNTPVYACRAAHGNGGAGVYLACGGGSGSAGFLGIPIHLVSVPPAPAPAVAA